MNHLHTWIRALISSMDNQLDEKTRAAVLENCGRACANLGFIDTVKCCKDSAKSTDELLDDLRKVWGHLHRDGDDIYVVYEECYCPLVNEYPGKLSPTFCNCSRGWVREVLETVLEKPVEVELEQSIKQGDQVCRFSIQL
ncbi:DUF6144 family protein [Candidatus Poribacteria bacterium]